MLDDRDGLLTLLDATIEARGTTVVVGREAGELGGGQLSIVGALYTDHIAQANEGCDFDFLAKRGRNPDPNPR